MIEALATGIPIVANALAEAELPPAHYIDAAIRFTVVLRQQTVPVIHPGSNLNETELRVYDALAARTRSVADLKQELDLSAPNIRKALRELRSRGLVEQLGGQGRPTTYRRVSE